MACRRCEVATPPPDEPCDVQALLPSRKEDCPPAAEVISSIPPPPLEQQQQPSHPTSETPTFPPHDDGYKRASSTSPNGPWEADPFTLLAQVPVTSDNKDRPILPTDQARTMPAGIVGDRRQTVTQRAEDKTDRVTPALASMGFDVSKGRTITSTMFGPGGAIPTYRPSPNTVPDSVEVLKQPTLIANHALVRDLSNVMLRQYHRPKLPWSTACQDRLWRFKVKKEDNVPTQLANSEDMIRTEADLSPSEGDLMLLEYCEEKPPVQLTKGMKTKIFNFYRGDEGRCPVSRSGGDRPPRASASNTGMDPMLPEGVTQILSPQKRGPFLGEINDGTTLTGFISNLFVAPMFRHEPNSTDFLMILTQPSDAIHAGMQTTLGVFLRSFPSSVYTVGQTEPRALVHAPQAHETKKFLRSFVEYQISQALRCPIKGLRFDEVQERILPNLLRLTIEKNQTNTQFLRNRLKDAAAYDPKTKLWWYWEVENTITAEEVAAFETSSAACRKLWDMGLRRLFLAPNHVTSVGVVMTYLAVQKHATDDLYKAVKELNEVVQKNRSLSSIASFYKKAVDALDSRRKAARLRYEKAQFVYEELQVTPWNLTGTFHANQMNNKGFGTMKLTGLGDPSGLGQGYSFLREVQSKFSKSVGEAALSGEAKNIGGTDYDFRKLTMKKMGAMLRYYGMAQKYINPLQRWDRVHCIRELSTKAASDGIGDRPERFACSEKVTLSKQKEVYQFRISVIHERQIAALSASERVDNVGDSESVSDSDDDFAEDLENEMMGIDANDEEVLLQNWRRQNKLEEQLQKGMHSVKSSPDEWTSSLAGTKVIRRCITTTRPDGRQKIHFEFVLQPTQEKVDEITARTDSRFNDTSDNSNSEVDQPPGHAMFEDEDVDKLKASPRQQNKLSEAQRKERQHRLEQLLLHATTCNSPKCPSANCAKMKDILKHGAQCQIKVTGGCKVCTQIWTLLRFNKRQCEAKLRQLKERTASCAKGEAKTLSRGLSQEPTSKKNSLRIRISNAQPSHESRKEGRMRKKRQREETEPGLYSVKAKYMTTGRDRRKRRANRNLESQSHANDEPSSGSKAFAQK